MTHGNPVIRHKFTADPAAIAFNGKVYMYTGHDEAPPGQYAYVMNDWLCFSSDDMVNWTEHPIPLRSTDFDWVKGGAWASQVIHRNGQFYWYVAVEHKHIPGRAIGVAVSDRPEGPFRDARGSALISNDMTTFIDSDKDDIDPTVIIDDDGQAYLFWGNGICYYARLKENMTELDGPIRVVDLPDFSEGAWIHKRNDWYYLLYGYQFPEKVAYAMSRSIDGPWIFKGIVNELAGNCQTNSPALLDFKGQTYFIYHNGGLPGGDSYRRSVCIDYLYYNPDGTIKRVVMSSEGVAPAHHT
ncbi:MAG TPA: glycoside hydrolase family 43 protein [Chitinophaga sp.]